MKALLVLAMAAATLPAQQVVTLQVQGTSSGLDLWNNRSVTRVKVGSAAMITFRFPPGDTPSIVAQRIAAGLQAQGIGAVATNSLVRIVTDQNGGPLRSGVDFGTNDTGHVGISIGIDGAGRRSSAKTSGCTLPYVTGGPTDPRGAGGRTFIDIDVEVPGPGGPQIVTRSLQVPWGPGQTATQINTSIGNALTSAGFRVRGVGMASVLNQIGSQHEGMQVDRDANGYPVRRVVYGPTVPLDMRWMEVHAGREPVYGTTDFGQPWNAVPGQPLILSDWGAPRIGTRFGVTVQTGIPNQLCFLVLGWNKTEIPLPMLGQGALLIVDPMLVISGIATANGGFGYGVSVPANPAVVGAPLHWQAGDMPPLGGTMRLSPGLLTVVW